MPELNDIKDRSPNEGTINLLETLLEQAKSGELRSIFYVVSFDDQVATHGWSMDARCNPRKTLAEMVMAQHDYVVNIELLENDSVLTAALDE